MAYFDRLGREIKAKSATDAAWKIVDRDKLKPLGPKRGPYDCPPRVKLTEKIESWPGAAGHWEWVLTRCKCGHAVLWPTNVATDNGCWFHREGGALITVEMGDLRAALDGPGPE